MAEIKITFSVARGIAAIRYGNDSYNYVHASSAIPVVLDTLERLKIGCR
jgi:hypothetical protein